MCRKSCKKGNKATIAVVVIVIAYIYNRVVNSDVKSVVVETKSGRVQGIVASSRDGYDYSSFRGIPYAEPPLGELRFESPLPVKPWDGVFDASAYGHMCTQIDMISGIFTGQENCLSINVFTRANLENVGNDKLLPVLVFIHGGLFVFGGSPRHEPDYFMDKPVVLVTFNYRLNSLGFFNTQDGVVRGNMGLKDQTQALKWCRDNIRAFGGNPESITIFGESAGSVSVHLHMLSKLSKGLFHRAISQSGTALSPWALFKNPREQALRFGKMVGCPTENTKEMVACMKKLTVEQIVENHYEVMDPNRDAITLFVPTVEKFINDSDTFLPDEPYKIIKRGEAHRVPWLTGNTKDEGLIYSAVIVRNETMIKLVNEKFEELAADLLFFKNNPEASTKIKNYYFPQPQSQTQMSDLSSMEKFANYTLLFSDRGFYVGLHQSVAIQSKFSPVYLYYNTYAGEFSLTHYLLAFKKQYPIVVELVAHVVKSWINKHILGMQQPFYGVCHADDVVLLFKIPWMSNIRKNDRDYAISKQMIDIWTTFATDHKTLSFRNIPWKPVDPSKQPFKYMQIGNSPGIIDEPFTERVKFWLSLNLDED